ncbi:MAG: response regulator [Hyphomicrobiales bacterium]
MEARYLESGHAEPQRSTKSTHILIVDDDPLLCRMLKRFLSSEGFAVDAAPTGRAMWRSLKKHRCDLVILDLGLPGGEDGFSLARALRADSDLALIILTGKSDNVDKVVGLELGADDYVTKPFEPRELLARIRSVLRRSGAARHELSLPRREQKSIEFSGWTLNLDRRELLSPSNAPVELTTHEFDLLASIAQRPGLVLSREEILEVIANRRWQPYDRSIDVLIGKLRRKLNDDPRSPQFIKTVRGVGYMFAPAIKHEPFQE